MRDRNVTRLSGRGLVGVFLLVSEVFLAVRFVLHFFAVSPTNGFAAWVFNSTNALESPFRGVFSAPVAGHPHYVDLPTLFIMFAYVVVATLLVELMVWGSPENLNRRK